MDNFITKSLSPNLRGKNWVIFSKAAKRCCRAWPRPVWRRCRYRSARGAPPCCRDSETDCCRAGSREWLEKRSAWESNCSRSSAWNRSDPRERVTRSYWSPSTRNVAIRTLGTSATSYLPLNCWDDPKDLIDLQA